MLDQPELAHRLKDPALLRQAAYVNGTWREDAAGGRFDVTNPATGAPVARLPDQGADAAAEAIDAAAAAGPAWARETAKARGDILTRWAALMREHCDDLARILTAEMGKPLAEARGEILYGASFLDWFAEEGRRLYGETIPGHQPDKRILVLKQPVGVVTAITPWNFPNAMIARKLAPALAAGCTFVVKPADETPLSALAMAVLAERAGVPAGVFHVLTGTDAAAIGQTFCAHPAVRKLTFTGSTETGRILMRQAADQILRLSLELGGNAPFIVFDDSDIDAAVEGAMISKYRNAGQTCVCANRLYVQAGVYEAFAAKLTEAVGALRVGPGEAVGVTTGPLINAAALEKVEAHVSDATAKGARVTIGGARDAQGGTFYQPTVLTGVTPAMRVAREETFGPVAPLFRFTDEAEVIAQANASIHGLASYFYARDLSRVWRVAEALDYGMVGINTGLISTEVAPFGGVKQSGLGREGARQGIEEYVETKYLCLSI